MHKAHSQHNCSLFSTSKSLLGSDDLEAPATLMYLSQKIVYSGLFCTKHVLKYIATSKDHKKDRQLAEKFC